MSLFVSKLKLRELYELRVSDMKEYFEGDNSIWDKLNTVEKGIKTCTTDEINYDYEYIKNVLQYIEELQDNDRWNPLDQKMIDFGDNSYPSFGNITVIENHFLKLKDLINTEVRVPYYLEYLLDEEEDEEKVEF